MYENSILLTTALHNIKFEDYSVKIDEKETNDSLSSQLASSQEEQLILHEKLKEVETALNFANEDICKKSQRLEEKETLLRDQISQISQFELEMVALNDQLNQFQNSKKKTCLHITLFVLTIGQYHTYNFHDIL